MTGYDGQVKEAARITDRRHELSETEMERLDEKLRIITDHLPDRPTVSITYFVPDKKKASGSYVTATGIIKKIDTIERVIVFYGVNKNDAGKKIPIYAIIEIESGLTRDFRIDG